MSEFHHVSVLLEECIQGLAIKPDGIYVDGTLGGAGHSSRIAAKLTTGRLIGIDRDNVALEAAAERLKPYEDRVTLVHANFCDMDEALEKLGIDKVDGILLDLGVSSPQLAKLPTPNKKALCILVNPKKRSSTSINASISYPTRVRPDIFT